MENSLRMVLSSCLLEEPLSLDLPFFSRLSSVLDQMGLQAVKQRQITDNRQKQGPDYWLRTIKAVLVPMPRHFPLSEGFLISERFSLSPSLLQEHFQSCSCLLSLQLFFFFFFEVAANSTWHWIRSLWICQSVFRMGWDPRFSLQQTDAGVCLSRTGSNLKNTTSGKYKQMKRSIYSGRRCCFPHETAPEQ